MTERFIDESHDSNQAHDISALELLDELTVTDNQRADARRAAGRIDVAAIGTSIDQIAHEFGPEGSVVVMIETLEGYVMAIEKQLSILDSQAGIIKQAMAEPLQVSAAASARLKEIYEQKRDIVRQIQELKRQKDTAANRKKIQDLEYQSGFAIAPREAEAQNDQLHADAVIARLEELLTVVVAGQDIRAVKLGIYEAKVQQLKEKVEKVSHALGRLAGAGAILEDVANEAEDWSDISRPDRLQEIDVETVARLASYGDYSSIDLRIDSAAGRQSPESPANISEFPDVVSIDAAYFPTAPEEVKQPDSIHPLLREAALKARRSSPAPKKGKRLRGFLRIN